MIRGTTIYARVSDHEQKQAEYRLLRDDGIDLGAARRAWAEALVGPAPPEDWADKSPFGLKHALAEAQRHRCGICGGPFHGTLTIDHVIPPARGGGNNGNRVRAHESCNGLKGDRWPTGCELIMLAATNAVLASIPTTDWSPAGRAIRNAAKNRRKRRRASARKVRQYADNA